MARTGGGDGDGYDGGGDGQSVGAGGGGLETAAVKVASLREGWMLRGTAFG